jgi:alpha-ketoglutarate-dependent taurine dioxygenase
MATLTARMGQLSGKPADSTLHVHPLTEESSELGDQIAVISSEKQAKGGGLLHVHDDRSLFATNAWHSDITFEPIPSDYAMLKLHTLPETGGDTMWASMYEAYDKLSPAMARWLETLTATHDANFFHDEARRLGIKIRTGHRGSPFNQGDNLQASHPIIRTNRKSHLVRPQSSI